MLDSQNINGVTASILTARDKQIDLSLDVDATCTQLVMILADPQCCKEILAWRGEAAQVLINLLQTHLVYFPPESPNRRLFLSVLLKLSRLSGLYPECLVRDDVQLIGTDPVAAGGFGEVWKGRVSGQELIAVKIMKIYEKSDVEKLLKGFSTEVVTWRQLSHPNVLPFYGVFHLNNNRSRVCLISPWMENGNIVQFLPKFPDADRIKLILDIAQGLEYLHKSKPTIIHGDLKGVNILITHEHRACLADFGLASVEDSQAVALVASSNTKPTGTPRWQAPELLDSRLVDVDDQGKNSLASDVYSFACVCYEVYSDNIPFYEIANDFRVILAVTRAERPSRPPHNLRKIHGISEPVIWALIESCWVQEPAKRPTASQIVDYLRSEMNCAVQDNVQLTGKDPVAAGRFGEVRKGSIFTYLSQKLFNGLYTSTLTAVYSGASRFARCYDYFRRDNSRGDDPLPESEDDVNKDDKGPVESQHGRDRDTSPVKGRRYYCYELNNYLQGVYKHQTALRWSTQQRGSEYNRDWEAVALINHVAYGTGTAYNLREAKEEAAHQALLNLRGY